MGGTVLVEQDGACAWITLNRPQTLNAWSRELTEDLRSATERVASDDSVLAVGIRGAGRGFSSGADLRDGRDLSEDGRPDAERSLRERCNPIISLIRTMPKPVLAAVNGPAAGIGCSLALACDLIIAADSAVFMLAFVRVGLAPDGGALPLLAARVGFTRAVQMAMTGERVAARRAEELGIVNWCVPDAELQSRAGAILDALAAGPPAATAAIKAEANREILGNLSGALDREAVTQQRLAESADHAEGVAAFRERRTPRFTPR